MKRLRDIASEQHTKMADAEDAIKKGIKKGELSKSMEIAKLMKQEGFDIQMIQKLTGLSKKELEELK